jgi:hypothetical protein
MAVLGAQVRPIDCRRRHRNRDSTLSCCLSCAAVVCIKGASLKKLSGLQIGALVLALGQVNNNKRGHVEVGTSLICDTTLYLSLIAAYERYPCKLQAACLRSHIKHMSRV